MLKLFHFLLDFYGEQHWWPSKSGSRWEIAAGAVLVQNTAWANVEKALDNLEAADLMSPETILSVPDDALSEIIRPAGFFKQKSLYLKAVAEFLGIDAADVEEISSVSTPTSALRTSPALSISSFPPKNPDA